MYRVECDSTLDQTGWYILRDGLEFSLIEDAAEVIRRELIADNLLGELGQWAYRIVEVKAE